MSSEKRTEALLLLRAALDLRLLRRLVTEEEEEPMEKSRLESSKKLSVVGVSMLLKGAMMMNGGMFAVFSSSKKLKSCERNEAPKIW